MFSDVVDLINQVPVHLGTLLAFAVLAGILFGLERLEQYLMKKKHSKE